ncbi:hypothetical protein FVE85_4467 [Porphyridium purpureum]|uniref:AI-2E family transporter n=1 Tax=Porphyridium purpureum TaxID=35688 RepID=A0A5J4YJM3_PORPP|nr:hypothetical protein FVE85_4467 [Porphyridium purpureum]|eukprot:POR8055..scf297_16
MDSAKFVTVALTVVFGYYCMDLFAPLLPGICLALLWFSAVVSLKKKLASWMRLARPSAVPATVICAAVILPLLVRGFLLQDPVRLVLTGTFVFFILFFYTVPAVTGKEELVAAIFLWVAGAVATILPVGLISARVMAEIQELIVPLVQASDPQTALMNFHRITVAQNARRAVDFLQHAGLPAHMLAKIEPFLTLEFEEVYTRLQPEVTRILSHPKFANYGAAFAASLAEQISIIGVFCICLLYMLQSSDAFVAYLASLSPYSPAQTRRLGKSLQTSARRILLCDFGTFLAHFGAGLVSLSLVSQRVDMTLPVWTLSTFIGALAVLPIFSSALVWLGVGLVCYVERNMHGIFMLALTYALLALAVQPLLYSFIPTGHYFLSGSAILLGLARYGATGIFLGPSVLCALLAVLDIVRFELEARHDPR